jgi:TonB family protein
MGFSNEVEQQRLKEEKSLKRWVGASLAGSFILYSGLLSLPVNSLWRSQKNSPVEVAIVPAPVKPPEKPPEKPQPKPPPEQRPIEQAIERPIVPAAELPLPPTVAARPDAPPEGRPDVTQNESALVGSGLAEGTGGFAEGIGLNRSNSSVRGSGGGARQGVENGVAGGTQPLVPAQPEPVVEAPIPAPPAEVPQVTAVEPSPDPAQWVVCRRCPKPNYPDTSSQAGAEGRVRVAVDIDQRGRVTGVRLAASSGDRALDQAVLETVQEQWRFETIAGGVENVPVDVYMTLRGSDYHQQAEEFGEQVAVEVPAAGFTTSESTTFESTASESTTSSQPDPSAGKPSPALPAQSASRPIDAESSRPSSSRSESSSETPQPSSLEIVQPEIQLEPQPEPQPEIQPEEIQPNVQIESQSADPELDIDPIAPDLFWELEPELEPLSVEPSLEPEPLP